MILFNCRALFLGALTLVALHAGVYAAAPQVEIDRIEVLGVSPAFLKAVEGAIEMSPGEKLEHARVVRSSNAIVELYRRRGFEAARVRSELLSERLDAKGGIPQQVLRFQVQEGAPTRIAAVSVVLDAQAPSVAGRLVPARTGLMVGAVLDRDRYAEAKRGLSEVLSSADLIGGTVEDPIERELSSADAAQRGGGRWVVLEFHVVPGERVTFGFRGYQAVTRGRLSVLLDEQRALGLSKDYVTAFRKKIEEEYRSKGYALAKVTPFTFERPGQREKHVTFVIEEGPRVELVGVQFDGNFQFSKERLLAALEERSSALLSRGIYVDAEVERAGTALVRWMNAQGYLGARLVTVGRNPVEGTSGQKMTVVYYLFEGDQTRVASLEVEGAETLGGVTVRESIGLKEGEPLDLARLGEGLEAVKQRYQDEGFLDAQLLNENDGSLVRYENENRDALLRLRIREGNRFHLSKVSVEWTDGQSGTREDVILREAGFVNGEVLTRFKLLDAENRLRRLGLFSSVNIRTVDNPADPTGKNVRINLEEGTPGILAGGVGLRNDLGARAFGQVGYTNLWKRNHTLVFNGSANRRLDETFCASESERRDNPTTDHCYVEYQLQLSYVYPWIFLGPTSFRPRVTFERVQYRNFDAGSLSFAASLDRKLWDAANLVGALTYSLERTQQFNAVAEEDNQTLTIGSLTPSLRMDLRDNSLAPTRGWFLTGSFEYASPGLGSQSLPVPVGYTRFQARVDRYIPLFPGWTWFLSFRTGFERNLEPPPASDPDNKRYAIPLIKQFALGGAASLRGFNEQELNVQNLAIRGTASYVNYRTQLDLPLAGALRFGPFLDGANLSVDTFTLGNLRWGAGFGFHYLSPVGPVNFDWGFKLFPRPDEEVSRFYFSIGVI